jgi:hypothetical protein
MHLVGALGERVRPASRPVRRDPERRKIDGFGNFLALWVEARLDAVKGRPGRTTHLRGA